MVARLTVNRRILLGFREQNELSNEMIQSLRTGRNKLPKHPETVFVKFMADGMKARLQRLNLFNVKQEQKDVSGVYEAASQ